MQPRVIGFGQTATGNRTRNEDALHVDNELGLFVVSDGMGGHAAGHIASSTAIASIAKAVGRQRAMILAARDHEPDWDLLLSLVHRAVQRACYDVFSLARDRADFTGMGCTVTLALVVRDQAVTAHVGDSRLYLWRADELRQLTRDHTLAQNMVVSGLLTREEAEASHLNNVLTRAVGIEPVVTVDTELFALVEGDRLLLCSDGLPAALDAHEDVAPRLTDTQLSAVPTSLVDAAVAAGAPDNVTVIAVEYGAVANAYTSSRQDSIASQSPSAATQASMVRTCRREMSVSLHSSATLRT